MKILLKLFIVAAAVVLTAVSCSDSNKGYVRKAVRIMDKDGLFAEGQQWDAAKAEALAASPATLEEAQEVVKAALKVAGGNDGDTYYSQQLPLPRTGLRLQFQWRKMALP